MFQQHPNAGLIAKAAQFFLGRGRDQATVALEQAFDELADPNGQGGTIMIAKNELGAAMAKAGLTGALNGIEPGRDQWNDGSKGLGTSAFEGPANRGPNEAASGLGADRMTARYSDPAPASALVDAYKQISDRLTGLEKAVVAVVDHIARAAGAGSFPADAEGYNGKAEEHGEDDDTRETPDQEELEKAASGNLPLLNVPQFLDQLGNRSRAGVTPPPAFVKAANGKMETIQDRLDAMHDDPNIETGRLMLAKSAAQAHGLLRAGKITKSQFERSVPVDVRQMIGVD